MSEDLTLSLRGKLAQMPHEIQLKWEVRPAAVLVLLYKERDAWHILLTKRTDSLASHGGQISFPGGNIDAADAGPAQAALREANEEIGLRPTDVEVLGFLEPEYTSTRFVITPVVGFIPARYELYPSEREVTSIFGVPISWFADPSNLEIRPRTVPPSKTHPPDYPIQPNQYYFKPYNSEQVWGVTARILLKLVNLLDVPQPHEPAAPDPGELTN